MVQYDEDYHAEATATDDSDGWTTDSRGEFEVGIPAEFGGEFEGPAPENYYAIALTNCYIATFKSMAKNSDLEFEQISAAGTLKLRPTDQMSEISGFVLQVDLHVDESTRKTEIILERTREYCFILDSVDFPVDVQYEITENQ